MQIQTFAPFTVFHKMRRHKKKALKHCIESITYPFTDNMYCGALRLRGILFFTVYGEWRYIYGTPRPWQPCFALHWMKSYLRIFIAYYKNNRGRIICTHTDATLDRGSMQITSCDSWSVSMRKKSTASSGSGYCVTMNALLSVNDWKQ
jgi:hypothetical protein